MSTLAPFDKAWTTGSVAVDTSKFLVQYYISILLHTLSSRSSTYYSAHTENIAEFGVREPISE